MSRILDTVLARPGETLAAHTKAVVAQVEQLESARPLPAWPDLYRRLKAAAWLHDSGKLALSFQRMLRNPRKPWGLRHEALSLAFVHWLPLSEDDLPWVLAAIATHHRDLSVMLELYRFPQRQQQLITELQPGPVRAWYTWLQRCGLVLQPFSTPEASAIGAALRVLEAWWTPRQQLGFAHAQMTEITLLRGLMLQADHRAAAGVPLLASGPPLSDSLAGLELPGAPWPHQALAAASRADCVVLRAPTGSGKTEAALLWAARQHSQRLFYALPYRTSMNAMRARLEAIVPNVGLQHGRALAALYQQALDDGADAQTALQSARARQQLARLHALPVRIFSPYHLLRLVYQFRGFEAGLADAHGAALIVDEIHAYQPERLALIVEMLVFLRRHFALRLLIMTATLPPVAAARLRDAFPQAEWITASAGTYARFQRHRLHLADGDLSQHLPEIAAQAQAGQRVLITVNTVRRALKMAETLRAQGQPVLLLHGRFNARDRWRIERELMERFPCGGVPSGAGAPVVVATQVIEVSLNVDFDLLHSDPAPLDALVQRFGRVNRAGRLPGLAPVTVYTQPDGESGAGRIYDPQRVRASLEVVRAHAGQPVDEAQIGDWLEAAYRDSSAWETAYLHKAEEFRRVLRDLRPLESADRGLMKTFARLFDEVRVLPIALEEAYRAASANPVEAESLLVSLGWGQYAALEHARKAWPGEGADEGLAFVDAPYSEQTGLNLYADEEE
jgi:CRISPR-associated endonuclease/helicase Cas3